MATPYRGFQCVPCVCQQKMVNLQITAWRNVPLKPKHFLPVSIKGFKDGDYAMIYGYPGGTNRYETSYGIKLKNEIENPSLVNLRDMRLKYMHEQMIKDPAVKLKLASNYAGVANYWKFFEGETKQLIKFHTQQQKEDYEKNLPHGQKANLNMRIS
jgi:hypothetical protein